MKTRERMKTVLLIVLCLGTVYLTYAVWFFNSPFGEISIGQIFNIKKAETSVSVGDGGDRDRFGIRPLAILVRDGSGSRGAEYSSDICDAVYDTLRDEYISAASSAESALSATEEEWREAVFSDGVFFDYKGNVPFDAIRLWLGADGALTDASGRYVFLSVKEEDVNIYIKNDATGKIFLLKTDASSENLMAAISKVSGSPCSFSSESDVEDYKALAPESLVFKDAAKCPVIKSYNTLTNFSDTTERACIDALGLSVVTPSTYTEDDGTKVYIADMITMKISPSGSVSYADAGSADGDILGIRAEASGDVLSLAEKAETARLLAAKLASGLPGDGGIYLVSASENGAKCEFVFGRHIGGIPVDSAGYAFFARIVMTDERVSLLTASLRGYDVTDRTADVLPLRLAAAAISGSGKRGDLNLRYADSGNAEISPAWFIGGMKKKGGAG